MVDTYVPPSYPLLRFIASHGMKITVLVAVLVLSGGLAVAVSLGSWIGGLAAVLGTVLLGGALASYVEMVRVIVDTLVPR